MGQETLKNKIKKDMEENHSSMLSPLSPLNGSGRLEGPKKSRK